MVSYEVYQQERRQGDQLCAQPQRRRAGLPQVASCAALTLALSLPQGLLALPIAVARTGLGMSLLILAVVGLLNVVTVAWTAGLVARGPTSGGQPPSLVALATRQLGPWGRALAVGSSATLFFLALLASLVGLGHSLGALTGEPAHALALGGGLLVVGVAQRRAALGARLLAGLGCVAVALLVTITLFVLPQLRLSTPAAVAGSPLLMVGVSQMLCFAPMLVPTVAQQAGAMALDRRALILGSALGVATSVLLAGLWAVAVVGVASSAQLAAASGTAIPLLDAALPALRPLARLLELLLLGLTALRCACILRALTVEQLPVARRPQPGPATALPALAAVALAVAALLHQALSFTVLIAIAGSVAASLLSLVLPALLSYAAVRNSQKGASS